jgi:TonB family protein
MKYKTLFFSVALLLSRLILSAQSDTTYFTYYFDRNGNTCNKFEAESYNKIKLVRAASRLYSIESYLIDGTLKSNGFIFENNTALRTGLFTEYFKDGRKKSEGNYLTDLNEGVKGKKTGIWTSWYENNIKECEQEFVLNETHKTFSADILNYWDSTGKQKVINGDGDYSFTQEQQFGNDSLYKFILSGKVKDKKIDGIWKGVYTDGRLYCEESYYKGELLKGASYDQTGKKYTYDEIEQNPGYKGGDSKLIKFLVENTNYPDFERSRHIQGKVLVRFIVDESGNVTHETIIHSVSPNLDKEALRVVRLMKKFSPGRFRGQPVKVYFNLPMVFRLQ